MRVGTKDYGKLRGGNGANTYFMREEESQKCIEQMISLIKDKPMSIYELSEHFGVSHRKLLHLLDTATLLYGNIWEECRRVKGREVLYYAAE